MRWRLAALVVLSLIVQIYLLSALPANGFNLVLVTLLYFGLRRGFNAMVPLAIAAGAVLDIIAGTAVGSRTLLYPALLLLWTVISRSGLEFNSRLRFALAVAVFGIILDAALLLGTWVDLGLVEWRSGLFWDWASRSLWAAIFAWSLPRPVK